MQHVAPHPTVSSRAGTNLPRHARERMGMHCWVVAGWTFDGWSGAFAENGAVTWAGTRVEVTGRLYYI